MPVFFNGRLWISPATMSVVDDSAMANQNLSVGNIVALIGRSTGGEPKKALRFGSPSEAIATLRSGELLTAVLKAFDPSPQTNGPSTVVALRVNPAQQGKLDLVDSTSTTVIKLVSQDYGLYTNQLSVQIESGSVSGKKLTTRFSDEYYTQDNVERKAFSVHYTGAQPSAQMSITGTTVTLNAPSGTAVATIDLNVFDSIQELVDRINTTPDFSADVLDGNGESPALNGLDYVNNVDVRTSTYTAKADLQAIVDWFNSQSEGYVTATRMATVGTLPVNIPATYLLGGSDGTVTNSDWSDAYNVLQSEDVQWVTPVSSDPSIHAMNDTHCAFMSNIARMDRRGIVGTAIGTTDEAAITAAKALNSDRTSLVHLGFYDYDAAGKLTLFPPYILAAQIAGAFSGVNPGTPLTNKAIKVRGLERKLRNPTDTDVLITGGVLCVEETSQGFKVVQSITSWLINDNYNRVEVSTGVATDFTARNWRNALDVLRGEKNSPLLLSRAISISESVLRELSRPEPQGPGVLVGDEANPPYKNIKASIEGDVIRVEGQVSPVIPCNYVVLTIFAKPYTGTATA